MTGTTGDGDPVNETAVTDANGLYLFEDLVPGTYKVTFPVSVDVNGGTGQLTDENANGEADDIGATDSDPNEETGMTDDVILTSGESELDLDAGYYVPGSIGDYVWEDTDGDGEGDVCDDDDDGDGILDDGDGSNNNDCTTNASTTSAPTTSRRSHNVAPMISPLSSRIRISTSCFTLLRYSCTMMGSRRA